MATSHTGLLVIGAGPYAYSAAAYAGDRGIDTHVVGLPLAFWRDQMPPDMYLRSGPDWHLDANREDTFEAFFEDRGLDPADHDPIPIGVWLDHAEWFAARKGVVADPRLVTELTKPDGRYVATLDDGTTIEADKVLAAPGVGYFAHLPAWHADVPADRRSHTRDLVSFDDLAGARVAIVGGRQSAYEWAALLCDHGVARVDVVHRHDTPEFAKVSWAFVDDYVDQTLTHRGWWRQLPAEQKAAVAQQFWAVGRLTLEPWLVPRMTPGVVHSHPGTEVAAVDVRPDGAVALALSDGGALEVDHVVFASGYQADLARVPYLAGVLDRVSVTDGFPDLSEGFETTLDDLYVVGFASTRDFGPFYGFTKGCPSAARIVVDEMLRSR
ncbi:MULTISPECIES: FAD-dependent oxidoreductase [unclassified Nocardioides]|uniref:FAD-dependent oxidoreductase n=1 Tax=unclassified Nocardioides TaxID=2615069 RepID=UPI0009F069F4|nr:MULTISPECIES: FAD-dependent oxidoreductase [unclassified Nocardioides]GAW48390.1 Putative dimethylaniline monooxygenase [Nocardioides sp. PD653-B2]GAW53315.1 putative dimethylaniline monooxygenase [Nocardioides sp. PD653]